MIRARETCRQAGRALLCLLAIAAAAPLAWAGQAHSIKVWTLRPSSLDAGVKQDDWPSWVMLDPANPVHAPLVLWLPGTHGKPGSHGDRALMVAIVEQGYRLVWLSYDNDISVSKRCPHSLDAHCSASFRRMRIYGTGRAPVTNVPAESIVSRLVHVLDHLQKTQPGRHWDQYLDGGKPNWKHIVVAGHSSGAGMAAFIAKRHEVARVVLFSSPWDDWHPAGHVRRTAPWLSWPSATPMQRWQAEYHKHEDTARLLAKAYAALGIPKAQIHVFALDLPAGYMRHHHHNPFHTVTTRDIRYLPIWKRMFGKPAGPR